MIDAPSYPVRNGIKYRLHTARVAVFCAYRNGALLHQLGTRTMANTTKAKQSWEVGDTVKVGFVAGLEVVAKVATPGDYKPDMYALWQPSTGRFYSFVPHNGLVRCNSIQQAMEW